MHTTKEEPESKHSKCFVEHWSRTDIAHSDRVAAWSASASRSEFWGPAGLRQRLSGEKSQQTNRSSEVSQQNGLFQDKIEHLLSADHVKDPVHAASVLWRPCLYDESIAKETNRGPQNSDKKEVEISGTKLGFNRRTAKTMQLYERETDGLLLLRSSSAQTSGEQAARISSLSGL